VENGKDSSVIWNLLGQTNLILIYSWVWHIRCFKVKFSSQINKMMFVIYICWSASWPTNLSTVSPIKAHTSYPNSPSHPPPPRSHAPLQLLHKEAGRTWRWGGGWQSRWARGWWEEVCDRTTSEIRGLSPNIISGDSRRSENAQTHQRTYTIP
jgi:hypothetical protein